MKIDKIMLSLIFAFVLIIGAMIYFNTGSRVAVTGNVVDEGVGDLVAENQIVQEPERELKKHIPLELAEGDILVSFRIDDITFEKYQKQVLENALFLARKYNITFDLAVMAQRFEKGVDPKVFKIYQDNQDVFEIVAHGLTHENYMHNKSCGEFTCAPYSYQEDHISQMRKIFKDNNLTVANEIFITPFGLGDNNTIDIANKYGYKLLVQIIPPKNMYLEYEYNKTIISSVFTGIILSQNISQKQINEIISGTNQLIDNNKSRIEIVSHTINFWNITDTDKLLNEMLNQIRQKQNIKISFISDRFVNKK